MDVATPVLEMKGISKRFPGVQALSGVDFRLHPGEVHALMGQNGAGKSTLIKVLTGVHPPDAGAILLEGEAISPKTPQGAQELGISTVYQEVNLCPNLSVAENIFLGRGDSGTYAINWRTLRKRAAALLEESLNLPLDVTATLSDYPIATQQMVAIARALAQQAKILVLDEPTSSLAEEEVQQLFTVIRRLKAQGMAIVFITHFLEQTFEVSDRISVLRNGELVGEYPVAALSRIDLVTKMVGREISETGPARGKTAAARSAQAAAAPVLSARGLTRRGAVQGVDLDLRPGQAVGMGGLLGSGRTETARLLFGIDPLDRGEVRIEGKEVPLHSPLDAIQHGVGFSPEDRKLEGIVGDLSVRENIILALQSKRGTFRALSSKRQEEIVDGYIKLLGTKTPDAEVPISKLSGGNQQKALLARWMATDPRMLILDEPTRGIDVAAKQEIMNQVMELCDKGMAVLFISSEMDEVVRYSDRVAVMRDRKKVGELEGSQADEHAVFQIIAGGET